MKNSKTHKDLDVWKFGMDLVVSIYKYTENFPEKEKFGLTSQIRRSSISIPSNIAEGAGRSSRQDYVRFLYISLGSASELETQIEIAKSLGYIDNNKDLQNKLNSIRKLLIGLIKYQKSKF